MNNKRLDGAINNLVNTFSDESHWRQHIKELYAAGRYNVRRETPPKPYDETCSEICWGWLNVGKSNMRTVATFGHGERGNEPYDAADQGLNFYQF